MVDSVQIFPPGFRVTDNSTGAPVSGAKIKFFDAGTTTPKTVYSDSSLSTSLGSTVYCDSLGKPVAAEGSSTAVMVYTGTAAYKCTITTSTDATVVGPLDNIKGALDTSTFLTTGSTSTLTIAVVAVAVDTTVGASHRSKLINASSSPTLTLTSAVTLGDGWSTKIRNGGTGQVKITGSQNIATPMGNTTAFTLRPGEGCSITCNGSTFQAIEWSPPLLSGTVGVIEITDRVTAAPASPTAGARYIVTSAFSTYEAEDIIEADGQGSFIEITPAADCGWLAFVQDEDAIYQFVGSAWAQIIPIPAASDTLAGRQENAVQSEMETATSTTLTVTPGRQHYHPGMPKAWIVFNGTGTPAVIASYGMHATTPITDNGVGDYTLEVATAFSASTAYGIIGWCRGVDANRANVVCAESGDAKTATQIRIRIRKDDGTAQDSSEITVLFFGDH